VHGFIGIALIQERVLEDLIAAGAKVKAYDPVAGETARRMLPAKWFQSGKLTLTEHQYDALDGATALALVTEWKPLTIRA